MSRKAQLNISSNIEKDETNKGTAIPSIDSHDLDDSIRSEIDLNFQVWAILLIS